MELKLSNGYILQWQGENGNLKIAFQVDTYVEMNMWLDSYELEKLKAFIKNIEIGEKF